jgi:alpha-L-rhamnosidase
MVSEAGLNDTVFRMVFQEQVPGWMAPVRNGATTWWERWDSFDIKKGFGPSGMNSFNHFSYGCINEWFNEYVLGFQQVETAPGFKEIVLQPSIDPTGRLTYAKGGYDSYYGKIESSWTADSGKLATYKARIPANTTATLYLPVDSSSLDGFEQIPGVNLVDANAVHNGYDVAVFNLESGGYEFSIVDGKLSVKLMDGYVVVPVIEELVVSLESRTIKRTEMVQAEALVKLAGSDEFIDIAALEAINPAYGADVEYFSFNPTIASIDENGVVTGNGPGTTEIQAAVTFYYPIL